MQDTTVEDLLCAAGVYQELDAETTEMVTHPPRPQATPKELGAVMKCMNVMGAWVV